MLCTAAALNNHELPEAPPEKVYHPALRTAQLLDKDHILASLEHSWFSGFLWLRGESREGHHDRYLRAAPVVRLGACASAR
jgi:hypothetical protein